MDGEIVAFDPRGVSHMGRLMTPGVDERFMAFDLLWLEGEDLRERPLEERRELLESVMANHPLPLDVAERLPRPAVGRHLRLEGDGPPADELLELGRGERAVRPAPEAVVPLVAGHRVTPAGEGT